MKDFFQKNVRTNQLKNEILGIRKWEGKIKRKGFKYKTNEYLYDIQQFQTIRSFDDSIYTGEINIDKPEMDQSNLLGNMVKFNNKSKPTTEKGKAKKQNTFDRVNALYKGRELPVNAFRSRIFPIKGTQVKGRPRLLVLHPKQCFKDYQ